MVIVGIFVCVSVCVWAQWKWKSLLHMLCHWHGQMCKRDFYYYCIQVAYEYHIYTSIKSLIQRDVKFRKFPDDIKFGFDLSSPNVAKCIRNALEELSSNTIKVYGTSWIYITPSNSTLTSLLQIKTTRRYLRNIHMSNTYCIYASWYTAL